MDITLRLVQIEEREILANLLEKYNYEFSQYEMSDVNSLGLYGYAYLDYYWAEDSRFAYFIQVGGQLAGFVMVNDYPEAPGEPLDYAIAEFFVMYKYRRMGAGKQAFFQVLDMHRGRWQIKYHPKNIPSLHFWNKMADEYTGGDFRLVRGYPGTEYQDGTPGDVIFLDNSGGKSG